LTNLGNVLGLLGELPAAREQLERALRLKEAGFGPDHIEVAITLTPLSVVLWELGESLAARERLERAVRVYSRALGTQHPDTQRAQGLLDSFRDRQAGAAPRQPDAPGELGG
jgi:hypothetical protein